MFFGTRGGEQMERLDEVRLLCSECGEFVKTEGKMTWYKKGNWKLRVNRPKHKHPILYTEELEGTSSGS